MIFLIIFPSRDKEKYHSRNAAHVIDDILDSGADEFSFLLISARCAPALSPLLGGRLEFPGYFYIFLFRVSAFITACIVAGLCRLSKGHNNIFSPVDNANKSPLFFMEQQRDVVWCETFIAKFIIVFNYVPNFD